MFQCRVCQVACSAKRISASPLWRLSSPRQSRDDASLVEIAEMAAFWMVHWLQWVLQNTGNTRITKYIGVRANSSELFHYTDLDRQIMPHKQNMHHNKYPKRYPKRQTQHNKQPIREADRQTNQPTQKWEKLTVVSQLIWGVGITGIAAVLITGEAFCK